MKCSLSSGSLEYIRAQQVVSKDSYSYGSLKKQDMASIPFKSLSNDEQARFDGYTQKVNAIAEQAVVRNGQLEFSVGGKTYRMPIADGIEVLTAVTKAVQPPSMLDMHPGLIRSDEPAVQWSPQQKEAVRDILREVNFETGRKQNLRSDEQIELYISQNGRCPLTNQRLSLSGAAADHVVPRSKIKDGDPDAKDNFRLTLFGANSYRGNRDDSTLSYENGSDPVPKKIVSRLEGRRLAEADKQALSGITDMKSFVVERTQDLMRLGSAGRKEYLRVIGETSVPPSFKMARLDSDKWFVSQLASTRMSADEARATRALVNMGPNYESREVNVFSMMRGSKITQAQFLAFCLYTAVYRAKGLPVPDTPRLPTYGSVNTERLIRNIFNNNEQQLSAFVGRAREFVNRRDGDGLLSLAGDTRQSRSRVRRELLKEAADSVASTIESFYNDNPSLRI